MIGKAIIIVKESLNSFEKDDILTMTAALAYYLTFSVAPPLLIAVSLAVWAGAVFSGALFMIGNLAIGRYPGTQVTNLAFGSAGSSMVPLMGRYYSSILLLFGAEFTRTQTRLQGRDFKHI